jgi:hypothetical protein
LHDRLIADLPPVGHSLLEESIRVIADELLKLVLPTEVPPDEDLVRIVGRLRRVLVTTQFAEVRILAVLKPVSN